MGLYKSKDYFTFDDVASYLNDLGICQIDVADEKQESILKNQLLSFVLERKLTPVFWGWALSKIQIDQMGIEQAKAILDNPQLSNNPTEQINTIKENNLSRGYFCLDVSQYKNLIKFGNLYINHYAPYCEKSPDIGEFDYQKFVIQNIDFFDVFYPKKQLYTIFDTPANKPIITSQDTPDPFNGYETTAITALIDVVNHFWVNHNKQMIPPKQDSIVDYIVQKYQTTPTFAKCIEQVARPEYAKGGGNKKLPSP